jgi:hypothetical protein
MTQTASFNNGVVLEPAELYYLLRTFSATQAIGLEAEGLFPRPGAAADAMLIEGFTKLQLHGWLRPAERPGRFNLNDELGLLGAVVADPQFVVVASKNLTETEHAVANHYLGAEVIVELTLTPERQIRLAFEADRPTLLRRVEELLAPTHNPLPPVRYSLPEPSFEALQAQARRGQVAAAKAGLTAAGLKPDHAGSLAQALSTPVGDGQLVVVRVAAGEILAGRKAALHNGPAGGWLARREEAGTVALSLETVGPGTVSGVVDSFLQSLQVVMELVA